jgi:tetratricopeptide (TPR) repeat protein
MWYILIEIDGFPQIEKIDPPAAEKILGQLARIFEAPHFAYIGRKGATFVYTSGEGDQGNHRIPEQLRRADAFLEAQSDVVDSYSVVVRGDADVKRLGRLPIVSDAVRFVYDVPEESGLWCDDSAAKELFSPRSLRKEGGFFRYQEENTEAKGERAKLRDLFESLLPLEEVLDRFTPFLNGKKQAIFHLIGPEGSGRGVLIEGILDKLQGKGIPLPWIRFYPDEESFDEAALLFRAIPASFLNKVPEYLVPREQRIWHKLAPLLELRSEGVMLPDARLILDLVLHAYVRYMESIFVPPVVVCCRMDKMCARSREFLVELMGRKYPGSGPLWIVSSEETMAEELKSEACFIEPLVRGENAAEEADLSIYPLYAQFHGEISRTIFCRPPRKKENPSEVLVESLEREDRFLLYVLSLLPRGLDGVLYRKVFSELGMEESDTNRRLSNLASYQLLKEGNGFPPLFPELYRRLGTGSREEDRRIANAIRQLLLENKNGRNFLSPFHAAQTLEKLKDYEAALEAYFSYAGELFFLDDTRVLGRVTDRIKELMDKPASPARVLSERFSALNMHIAVDEGDEEKAKSCFRLLSEEIPEPKGQRERELYAKWLLIKGEYLWHRRSCREAMTLTKDALLRCQDLQLREWEAAAQLLLGKIMLSLQRVEEAVEYFHNASQLNLDEIHYSLTLESSAFVVLTNAMLGDYSLSLTFGETASKRAAERGRWVWHRYLEMMRGKILFELGRYRAAAEVFNSLLVLERIYFSNKRKDRFTAWLARALMYQGFIAGALRLLSSLEETPEHLLFSAEAQLLNRDFSSALSTLERALEIDREPVRFVRPIALLYRNGFEAFENIVLRNTEDYDVLYQLIRSMRGFLLSRLGRMGEAEEDFVEILEAEKRVKIDPYRHLYYFFRTLAHEDEGESGELTKATFLSKAFQNLQKIAGRIADPSDRRSFLTDNYWNSKLFSMSKEHKLI